MAYGVAHVTGRGMLSTGASLRRVLDIAAAIAGLICLSPLIALIAAAICADSGWPVFFAQTRLGQGGRYFRLYKFRKFQDKGCTGGRAVTVENDPRLSRVGKFLERTKLDELPQLWNILKGDMSLVGPRPESRDFEDCFGEAYHRVLDHTPGIFGPSQAMFRNEGTLYETSIDPEQFYRDVLFPTKARIDLAYYPSRTLLADISWVIHGMLAVFGCSPLPRKANLVLSTGNKVARDPRIDHALSICQGSLDIPPH